MRYRVLGSFTCPHCGGQHERTVELCPRTGRELGVVQKLGGTVLEGRIRISRIIAEGGMGVVYRGHQRNVDRDVAVKFLNPDVCEEPESYEGFIQEARLAGRIDHPGIVKVFDLGTTQEGIPYIVMELLTGEDLATHLSHAGRMELADALQVTEQLLRVLGAVHAAGIVHRDLKPENVFLARESGGSTAVKILDFGVSLLVGGETGGGVARASRVYGTPHYVSPEQARGRREVDHRSDLYSLSVLLFEMLVGVPPFQADSPVGLLLDIVSSPPPNPLGVRPDLPPAVAGIIIRGLEKRPEDRFQSAREMLAALDLARRVERYRKPRRRRRPAAGTGTYRIIGPPREAVSSRVPFQHLLDSRFTPGPNGVNRTAARPAARRESVRTRPMNRDRQPTPSRRADVTPNPDLGDPEE
jgi:serine/threonine-protein kinase